MLKGENKIEKRKEILLETVKLMDGISSLLLSTDCLGVVVF
jgi:hypothetical protein